MTISKAFVYRGSFPWSCRNCHGPVRFGQDAFRIEADGFIWLSHLNLDDHVFADWRAHAPQWLRDML